MIICMICYTCDIYGRNISDIWVLLKFIHQCCIVFSHCWGLSPSWLDLSKEFYFIFGSYCKWNCFLISFSESWQFATLKCHWFLYVNFISCYFTEFICCSNIFGGIQGHLQTKTAEPPPFQSVHLFFLLPDYSGWDFWCYIELSCFRFRKKVFCFNFHKMSF